MVLRFGFASAAFGAFTSPAGFCGLEMGDDVSCDEVTFEESTVCLRYEVGVNPYLSFR